jgi:hypothetical protein
VRAACSLQIRLAVAIFGSSVLVCLPPFVLRSAGCSSCNVGRFVAARPFAAGWICGVSFWVRCAHLPPIFWQLGPSYSNFDGGGGKLARDLYLEFYLVFIAIRSLCLLPPCLCLFGFSCDLMICQATLMVFIYATKTMRGTSMGGPGVLVWGLMLLSGGGGLHVGLSGCG